MIHIADDELKKILTESGYVSDTDLEKAFETASRTKQSVVDVLLGNEVVSEEILTQTLAHYFGVPFADLRKKPPTAEALELLPEEKARKYRAVPLEKTPTGITVAVEDPSDLEGIKFLRDFFKEPVEIVMATSGGIHDALGLYSKEFGKNFAAIIKENIERAKATAGLKGRQLEEAAKDVPVVRILNAIFDRAADLKASDIHFEPEEDKLLIRFRVDGVLKDIIDIPSSMQPAIVSRVKILSNLKIDEHRLPQEGRFQYESPSEEFSVRVSVIPTQYGERVEMRLLLEEARPYTLTELGLSEKDREILAMESRRPYGMILVTGPTGSGKTTTLYAVLQLLNDPKINIMTVEDPVEYSMPRISQMQINESIGLTFAEGLKALLRQDPNVIMIGEVRDAETAKTAVNAALTGHILLSTLHTNDAAGAIPRLIDLGVESFLLASTLRAVVGQRLVRKLCPSCIRSVKLEATPAMVDLIRELALIHEVPLSLIPREVYQPTVPCAECPDGYRGRSGIYEVLRVTPAISNLILERAPAGEIKKQARKEGMTTMLEDGLRKVQIGLTTLEEVIRVIKE